MSLGFNGSGLAHSENVRDQPTYNIAAGYEGWCLYLHGTIIFIESEMKDSVGF